MNEMLINVAKTNTPERKMQHDNSKCCSVIKKINLHLSYKLIVLQQLEQFSCQNKKTMTT